MELMNMEKLITKYIEVETSLEEEITLKNYFLSNNVAPHLKKYKPLFEYFQESKNETFTKTIQLKSKKINLKWLSIAASIVLFLGVYTGYNYYHQKQIETQYAQVKETLELLSTNLKKSDVAIANLYTYENTVNKIFKSK